MTLKLGLPSKGRLVLVCQLPWVFTEPREYSIKSQLARRNPRADRLLERDEWLKCPDLKIQVERQAKTFRGWPLLPADALLILLLLLLPPVDI